MDKPTEFNWGRATAGLVAVAVGVLFLLRNYGVDLPFMYLHNWWALFIYLAALPSLGYALQRYRNAGKVDAGVLHSLLSGGVVITVATILLLDLSWEKLWPLFVICGGLFMMVRGGYRRRDS